MRRKSELSTFVVGFGAVIMTSTRDTQLVAEAIKSCLEKHSREMQTIAASVQTQLRAIGRSVEPSRQKLQSVSDQIACLAASWQQELPPQVRDALLVLGEHGWYLDHQMPMNALFRVAAELTQGDAPTAEMVLSEYFEKQSEAIEQSLSVDFRSRSRFITAAFKAHRMAEFALSIPVLLIQTEGICIDVTGLSIFSKENGKLKTAEYVNKEVVGTMRTAILSPFCEVLPINRSVHDSSDECGSLNRHLVLHGRSLDYDTRTNSLKAISLINYVAQALYEEPLAQE